MMRRTEQEIEKLYGTQSNSYLCVIGVTISNNYQKKNSSTKNYTAFVSSVFNPQQPRTPFVSCVVNVIQTTYCHCLPITQLSPLDGCLTITSINKNNDAATTMTSLALHYDDKRGRHSPPTRYVSCLILCCRKHPDFSYFIHQ